MKFYFSNLLVITFLLFVCSNGFSQQTIILKPGPSEGKDARVWSIYPNGNSGDYEYMKANAWTWGGEFGLERSFIEFDLGAIPENAEIQSAKLSFYYHFLGGAIEQTHSGDNSSLIQRIVTPWYEFNVTWDNQPVTTGVNQVIVPPSTDPQQDFTDIDVTDLVIDMLDDPDNSFGFLFRIFNEDTYRRLAFASSDHPVPDKWPMLVITIDCDVPIAGFDYIVGTEFVQFTDLSINATSWNWDFGDGYSSTLQNPVHEYYSPGLYHVCLIVENDCGADTICNKINAVYNSINNITSSEISIFPNPTTGISKITFKALEINYMDLEIINAQGIIVQRGKKHINNNSSIIIDFSGFNTGIYYIKFVSDKIHEVKKIIIE